MSSLTEERERCSEARDIWYDCLDSIPSILPHPACDETMREMFEVCRASWSKRHIFRRMRVFCRENPHYQVDVEADLNNPYEMLERVRLNRSQDASYVEDDDSFIDSNPSTDRLKRRFMDS